MSTEKYGISASLVKSTAVTPVSTSTALVFFFQDDGTDIPGVIDTYQHVHSAEEYAEMYNVDVSSIYEPQGYPALAFTFGHLSDIVVIAAKSEAKGIELLKKYINTETPTSFIVVPCSETPVDAAGWSAAAKDIGGHWNGVVSIEQDISACTDSAGALVVSKVVAKKMISAENVILSAGKVTWGDPNYDNIAPVSVFRAILTALSDAEYGGVPARCGGNLVMDGINDFYAGTISEDQATELSADGICSVITYAGRFFTWGDHTSAFSGGTVVDERARFDNSIRILYMIMNRFQLKYRFSIDSPLTLQMRNDIINEETDYLNSLAARGALLGQSRVAFVPTPDDIQQGYFTWSIQTTPTIPLKYAHVNVSYTTAGLSVLTEEV